MQSKLNKDFVFSFLTVTSLRRPLLTVKDKVYEWHPICLNFLKTQDIIKNCNAYKLCISIPSRTFV
jgi:hypothetical protein